MANGLARKCKQTNIYIKSNAKQASTNVNKARKQRESSEWADVSKQANA
jgi:hypothetical protein